MSSLAYYAYRGGSAVLQHVPAPVARAGGRVAAVGARLLGGDRRRVVARNLERVAGRPLRRREMRRGVQRTFDSYARYWIESLRLPSMDAAAVDAGFSIEGLERLTDARARGVGPILALPHLGGWEWAAFFLTLVQGIPVTAVVERLEPPDVYEWFVSYRRSLGINVVPLGPSAGSDVARAIRAGHATCLLADRDLTGGGIEVEFFGEVTTLPAGPATMALRTGAPLLPTAVYFTDTGNHGVVRPPLSTERHGRLRDDIGRVTQDLAHELEILIRRAPEQWHLMQPNWPSDR